MTSRHCGAARTPSAARKSRPPLMVGASVAEKFHAMVDLDMLNSRMKDFYGIWVLSRTIDFSGSELSEAIRLTFEQRKTTDFAQVISDLTAFLIPPVKSATAEKVFKRNGRPKLEPHDGAIVPCTLFPDESVANCRRPERPGALRLASPCF
jgi:hypothetical protein